ncbi:MAG TPA: polysaccharide biosynthesis tyrosine autokinase [Geothrix sp.]|nr:polysaccharide biosynthesis tyrosine autokinase [Geothrix sp.]
MTNPVPPALRPVSQSPTGTFFRLSKSLEDAREIDLREWVVNLWSGRYLILAFAFAFLALGALYIWRSTPIYQAEALLQIEPPKATRDSDAAYTRMENLFPAPFDATTEIEIIGSNMVLGRTVQALALDVVAKPELFPVFGEAMVRNKPHAPKVEVDTFELPDDMRGLVFQLVAKADGAFVWKSPLEPPSNAGKPGATFPQGVDLATGRPGELLTATYGGETLKLQLRRLTGKPGQVFNLVRRPMLGAITDIRNDLEAAEKGVTQPNKSTNLLSLAYRNTSPAKAAEILNEIMKQYVQQNVQRKSEEITRTLDLLQQQLPEVHAKMELAENRLNRFRAQTGSVDIPREADLALQQHSNLAGQITALKQRKEELRRIYQENADVVVTLNAQIAKLEAESAQVSQKVRAMPGTQQELVRLTRDVQVNTELYTALRNNIQQLQITRAGEGHNSRIVDYAMPGLKPIKPKKEMLLAVFLVMGLFLGVGVVLARRALQQGIEDHRIIETKLGLSVFVTIPHSRTQEDHFKALCQRRSGTHLLALQDPDDLATESLRSLRTMLAFSMGENPNRAIMVTGPSPKVGKSFVSGNFSVVLAQAGAKVLLVDADMRRGNLHKYFGLGNRLGGLSEIIAGLSSWKVALHKTAVPGLHVISSGEIPNNPAELLMSPGFATFLADVSGEYDYVVIDAPPLLPVTDATIIGSKVGTVLLVAKAGQHTLDELRACQSRLDSCGVPLKGCVFNDLMPIGLGYYDQHYRYAYHYKYERADNS